jgi:hypothetical protein
MQEVSHMMRKPGTEWVADVAERVREGLLCTPYDVVHESTDVDKSIQRILACLPDISPFQTIVDARADLEDAVEQYDRRGILRHSHSCP